MDLDAYLRRIDHHGSLAADLATLRALHRAHLEAIPYENIDVQLGRTVVTDPAAVFDRIVHRGRGGWCYEMNGVLGWALGEAGFRVTRLAGGVMREVAGDDRVGNHLVLKVDLPEGPWIADVGFGDGPIEPYPLTTHDFEQEGYAFSLADIGEGWWRVKNHPLGGAPSFDFRAEAADEALLSAKCAELQTSPESNFVKLLICQRATPKGLYQLRGRVLRTVQPGSFDEQLIEDEDEFRRMLGDVFGLSDPEIPRLWRKVCERHAAVFATT